MDNRNDWRQNQIPSQMNPYIQQPFNPGQPQMNPYMQQPFNPGQPQMNPYMQQPFNPGQPQMNPYMQQPNPGAPKQQGEAENTVGKILMAVFASIFICISLVLFVLLILPNLGNIAKMAVMYIVSAAFTAAGMILLHKDRENKGFLALAACGTGMVYISFMATFWHFTNASHYIFYILLLAWSVFAAIMGRIRSVVFPVVGQAAVLITLVGEFDFKRGGPSLYIGAMVFYALAEALFFAVNSRQEYHKNAVHFISLILGIVPVANLLVFNWSGNLVIEIVGLLLAVLLLVVIILGFTAFQIEENHSVGFGIYNSIYLFAIGCSLATATDEMFGGWGYVEDCVMIPLLALTLVALELRFPKKNAAGKVILQCGVFLMILMEFVGIPFLRSHALLAVPALIFLVYGFWRNNRSYKIAGLAYSCLLWLLTERVFWHFSACFVVLVVAAVLIVNAKEQYHSWFKVLLLFGAVSILAYDAPQLIGRMLALTPFRMEVEWRLFWGSVLAALVNLLAAKIPACNRSFKDGRSENAIFVTTCAVNMFFMVLILSNIWSYGRCILSLCYMLFGCVLFGMNTVNLIKKLDGNWSLLYIAGKWFVFLLTVLYSFKVPGAAISLIGIVFSIVCIAVGFILTHLMYRNFAATRIFGLVTVMLSLLKLLLFDVYFTSMAARAASFFAAGMLCFAISFLYAYVEKKTKNNIRR